VNLGCAGKAAAFLIFDCTLHCGSSSSIIWDWLLELVRSLLGEAFNFSVDFKSVTSFKRRLECYKERCQVRGSVVDLPAQGALGNTMSRFINTF
jgi:hypothetical protein